MKKRIGFIIAVILTALILSLLIWRFWPQSSSDLLSANENSITSFSAYAMVSRFENGQSYTDTYRIDNTKLQDNVSSEIVEILATSRYQQDFRNLLPWGIDSVSSDKNYDGCTVTLAFYSQGAEKEYWKIQFLSSSIAVVTSAKHPGYRIYHPTNQETINKLIEYLQVHGNKASI